MILTGDVFQAHLKIRRNSTTARKTWPLELEPTKPLSIFDTIGPKNVWAFSQPKMGSLVGGRLGLGDSSHFFGRL